MANLIVCAVFDNAVASFGRPFFVPAVGAAVRSFQDEVNRVAADNLFHLHPADYALYRLGTFDEETGHFDSLEIPQRIALATDFQVKE